MPVLLRRACCVGKDQLYEEGDSLCCEGLVPVPDDPLVLNSIGTCKLPQKVRELTAPKAGDLVSTNL